MLLLDFSGDLFFAVVTKNYGRVTLLALNQDGLLSDPPLALLLFAQLAASSFIDLLKSGSKSRVLYADRPPSMLLPIETS